MTAIPKAAIEARAWCQPDYNGKIHPRKFMVVYEDAEMRPAIFDDEDEAREHFEQATINWNCYLFGLLPREPESSLPAPALPEGWRAVPEKPTKAMMYAAACAHYGKRQVDQTGVDGVDMTANSINYTFPKAFRRFWNGALAAAPELPAIAPQTEQRTMLINKTGNVGKTEIASLPVAPQAPRPRRIVRHKKRGSIYEVVGSGRMQAEGWCEFGGDSGPSPSVDMREITVYRSLDDGSIWVRPVEEFEDGRFEDVGPQILALPSAMQPNTIDINEAASDLLRAYDRDNRFVGYRADLWDRLKAIMSRELGCIDRTKTQLAKALRASDQSNHDMLHMVASMISAIRTASPKLADRFQALADTAFEKWPRTETAEALAAFEKEKGHG